LYSCVPTTVYEGDERGAGDACAEWSSKATEQGYRTSCCAISAKSSNAGAPHRRSV